MASDANPAFEVVTIKPSSPDHTGKNIGVSGRHFKMTNFNLEDIIGLAYGLHIKQVIGLPEWSNKALYDIDGVPDTPGLPSIKQMGLIDQKLLADRFHLQFHRETRQLSVFAITVAPGGPKLTKTTALPTDMQAFYFKGLGDLTVRNQTMSDFATWMQTVLDRPVVDHTGLTDRYDLTLKWTPDDSQFAQFRSSGMQLPTPSSDPNAPPSLYTAIQEQLGLKMEAVKAPDVVLVIDHVDKPTAN
jgi:uncharacterized protein (TIGR03435 family)